MEIKKYIAFQTVDKEGDIWCNEALLFETEEKVNEFFNNPELVLKTLEIELEKADEEYNDLDVDETIDNIGYTTNNHDPNETINRVTFYANYCGKKEIVRMSKGFLIL